MERALNLAQIQDALGQHESLPTPEELRRLMANLEVELFRHQLQVPDSVLNAGWYLHGIASSSAAPDMYSVERQRSAFQISAHVFDLAVLRGEVVPDDADGGGPAERSVGSVVIVEVDELEVADVTLGL